MISLPLWAYGSMTLNSRLTSRFAGTQTASVTAQMIQTYISTSQPAPLSLDGGFKRVTQVIDDLVRAEPSPVFRDEDHSLTDCQFQRTSA